ncbi:AAA family ATPase [Ureaplasma ceti]|uniref:Endonuclease GajA/Old nuclease/RecF-like AAA domain-containing protein n=1 Tax=Ureaplasma ceti TaxID=3119530 RepID=A0ABP9U8L8_9BACT
MSVKLELQNYRNISVGTKKSANLILDRSLDSERKMGDLVILIGSNNSGKSNILDALLKMGTNTPEKCIRKSDEPYCLNNFSENDLVQLSLRSDDLYYIEMTRKCNDLDSEWLSIQNNIKRLISNEFIDKEKISKNRFYFKNFKYLFEEKNTASDLYLEQLFILMNTLISGELSNVSISTIGTIFDSIAWLDSKKTRFVTVRDEKLKEAEKHIKINDLVIDNDGNEIKFSSLFKNNLSKYKEIILDIEKTLIRCIEYFPKHCSFKSPELVPYVYKYYNVNFIDQHFTYKLGNENNILFNSIFNFLERKNPKLTSKYILSSSNKMYLMSELKRPIKELSDSFNSLFKEKDYYYKFDICHANDSISFEINKEKVNDKEEQQDIIPCPYTWQSDGFKWFFNLYFIFLINIPKMTQPGDIILIDEPATNICMSGAIELREMLKKIALQYNVTILITTHNAYLVDPDFLEELRIVDKQGDISKIYNNFNYGEINCHGSNTLKGTLNSLKCLPNALTKCNCSPKYVFVEGVTDYLYLTGIKRYFLQQNSDKSKKELKKYERLIFIPINGAGKDENVSKDIYEKICEEYEYNDCLFLVDGDDPGRTLKKQEEKDKIKVFTITDLLDNKNIIEIEDLIDESDIDKFNLLTKDSNGKNIKKMDIVYPFKRQLILNNENEDYKISNETIKNLTELFIKLA